MICPVPVSTSDDQDILDLNRDCHCFPIARDEVISNISTMSRTFGMRAMLAERPHYFASTGVFLSQSVIASMHAQISAIEETVKLPAYRQEIFSRHDEAVFSVQRNTSGVFMGYDFHITAAGPRLIEVNSNAGGAFIVNALERSVGKPTEETAAMIHEMFLKEWKLAGRSSTPKTIAIVDEDPTGQYHYPDMCLARTMLERRGLEVFIVDPDQLSYDNGVLRDENAVIDMVYNRLTDFGLAEQRNHVLSEALLADAAVITPSPRHHALHADKRNLPLLSNDDMMKKWDVSSAHRAALAEIPRTIVVTQDNAEKLWTERKKYFFKPNAGFGSRAAYRGAKLTKKTWQQILSGGYVAQEFIAPPVRAIPHGNEQPALKFDVRVYTYDGQALGYAARVYQGQTTNLRTEGGGLAPVLSFDNCAAACGADQI